MSSPTPRSVRSSFIFDNLSYSLMHIVKTPTGAVDTTLDGCCSSSSMKRCSETPNVDFKPKEERMLPFPANLSIADVLIFRSTRISD